MNEHAYEAGPRHLPDCQQGAVHGAPCHCERIDAREGAEVERLSAQWLDSMAAWTIEPLPHGNSVELVLASAHDAAIAALTAELQQCMEALESIRVFAQDCIENGHDRGQLGNLYSIRDLCDRAALKERT